MTKMKKSDLEGATKIVIMPWEKGFTCGIVFSSKATESGNEEEDMIAIIARGMIKQAVMDPHSTYMAGLKGFADDKHKVDSGEQDIDEPFLSSADLTKDEEDDNVIDFFDYYKPREPKDIN